MVKTPEVQKHHLGSQNSQLLPKPIWSFGWQEAESLEHRMSRQCCSSALRPSGSALLQTLPSPETQDVSIFTAPFRISEWNLHKQATKCAAMKISVFEQLVLVLSSNIPFQTVSSDEKYEMKCEKYWWHLQGLTIEMEHAWFYEI